MKFQSLLWWNTSEKYMQKARNPPHHPSFNPCCGGIPLRSSRRTSRRSPGSCFNPCCGGIPLRRIDFGSAKTSGLSFQSLLWWNTSEKKTSPRIACWRRICFNPCCGGIPLRRKMRRTCFARTGICFNPCCGGIPLRSSCVICKMRANRCFNPCCGGIPLRRLVFVDAQKKPQQCFNPCCGGIPLRS